MNRLNKTKEEKIIDFAVEAEARLKAAKIRRRNETEKARTEAEQEKRQIQEEQEIKSYGSVFKHANMISNKRDEPIDAKKFEEDFF